MTKDPQQIQRLVCEKAGFKKRERPYDYMGESGVVNEWSRFNEDGKETFAKNYIESIDAIRALVMKEDEEFQSLFQSHLLEIYDDSDKLIHQLTALDWCIAFLRAKGIKI